MPRRPSDGWTSDRFTGFIFRNSISRIFRIASPPTEEPRTDLQTNASPVTRCHIAEQAIMIPAWYSAFIGSGISALSDSADRYRFSSSAFHRESGLLIFLSSIVTTTPRDYRNGIPLLISGLQRRD
jgi:hypothetical protein